MVIVPSDELRVARLSHLQWENSIRDLLGLSDRTGLSSSFINDRTEGVFDNEVVSLGVDQVLFQQYQDASAVVASMVIDDPTVRAFVVGDSLTTGGPEGFVRAFGARVHRSPISDEDVALYLAAWDDGVAEATTGDPTVDGLRQTLEAMFQSPKFLYRVENDYGVLPDGTIEIGPYGMASRLSYALWNTLPDADLLAAAADGSLTRDPAVLEAQVDRMIADPRSMEMLADLHDQLLKVELYINVAPDTVLFPDYDLDTVPVMQAEVRAYVREVIRTGGGVRQLLTSTRTFVNPLLADIYGLPPVADTGELVPVDLDPSQRGGLLTLAGFLATQSDPDVSNPIRRGFFVNTFILCNQLPTPPAFVQPIPPATAEQTTRDRIDAATGEGTCGQGCHSAVINPVGFAFEEYGPLGEFRTEERGMTVDASDTFFFEEGEKSYANAIEFSRLASEGIQAHRCYTRNLFEYTFGRFPEADADKALVESVGLASQTEDLSTQQILRRLVLDPTFRQLPPAEE